MVLRSHGREFECTYKCNSRSSNLVINIPKGDTPIYYQVDMLMNNRIGGVLNMNMLATDERLSLYYDVTSKLTLAKYLGLKKLNRLELLSLLLNITTGIRFCDGYMLYDRCFVFNEDYIFVDPVTLRTYLVYIPLDTDEDFPDLFKQLVLNIITRLARLADGPGDGNYIQMILENLKSESFSVRNFWEMLNSMIDETTGKWDGSGLNGDGNNSAYQMVMTPEKEVKDVKQEETSHRDISSRKFLERLIGSDLAQRMKKKRSKKTSCSHPSEESSSQLSQPFSEDGIEIHCYETELLEKTSMGVPVLRGLGEARDEEIPIVKSEMVIGRLAEIVDFVVKNMSIGKVHAEVVYRNGEYYIRDLNSKNGTYINGEKIDSNMDYRIKNGDTVTLANCDYEFIVP